jgi:2-amino-4-hydroxy-6-hydroxymethyldihydropteridine diphosphokinase
MHLRRAIHLLRRKTRFMAHSICWESPALGSPGPNFLNIGVLIATPMNVAELKASLLSPIENQLGRVRNADKNAPRTIDIDITIFDGQVLDVEVWERVYLTLIFSEMLPGLRHPENGETLAETARRLQETKPATPHPEIELLEPE